SRLPETSLREREMKGTLAPSSSRATVATTCSGRTASSEAIRAAILSIGAFHINCLKRGSITESPVQALLPCALWPQVIRQSGRLGSKLLEHWPATPASAVIDKATNTKKKCRLCALAKA